MAMHDPAQLLSRHGVGALNRWGKRTSAGTNEFPVLSAFSPTAVHQAFRASPFEGQLRWLLTVCAVVALQGRLFDCIVSAAPPPNILFIAIDDLRPQLHCYGCEEMKTPSIDRLAQEGRLFTRHYVQVPTCGASRCALLTGRYPAQPEHYGNNAFLALPRSAASAVSTLPGLFRSQGYHTASIGKITHSPDGMTDSGEPELPFSWDEVGVPTGRWRTGWDAFFAYADGSTRIPGETPATERANVPDDGYPDGLIAEAAIEKLHELKEQPFFLAVGFFKPHLPFNAPSRYWELYDDAGMPPAPNADAPIGVDPAISLHKSGELTPRYTGLKQAGVVDEEEATRLRHAYAACVSYVDAQVGRVLDELDQLGLNDNTIVVLWGDHGWHLGEHGVWGKHSLHEVALRSPLIVRVPQQPHAGEPSGAIVESVDVFPTLVELCGLSVPQVDGKSFAAALKDPAADGKEAALGFWAGGRAHSLRTERYRLTEWRDRADPARVAQVELYDHHSDRHETKNIAADRPELVEELTAKLRSRAPLLKD
jgi:arylsulfatase A-like enzyme